MRIAFLDSWVQTSAEGSGTAVAIGGLQDALSRKGHQITRLAPSSALPGNLLARRMLFNARLPRLLRNHDFDLVVGFDIDGFLWRPQQRGATPYLVSVKGVLAEEARQERGQPRAMLWSLSRLERRNVRQAHGVLTTSDYCRQAIAHHYDIPQSRVAIVPEGIDLAHWAHVAAAPPRRAGATILCVARQYPRKHVADLVRAMVEVRQTVPQARAIIIGDGPEHATLQRLVRDLRLEDSVRLMGAIPSHDAVARAYAEADLFCLPSVQEGFGIAFLEAMASGLPVVSTTATAIPETVPHGEAGLLVPPGDGRALAGALIELLGDERLRRRLGDGGRAWVRRFDWSHVADIFLAAAQRQVQHAGPVPARLMPDIGG